MKSRILAVLFAVVLTAGTLAGCGSSKKQMIQKQKLQMKNQKIKLLLMKIRKM